jgi:hypothetical protein
MIYAKPFPNPTSRARHASSAPLLAVISFAIAVAAAPCAAQSVILQEPDFSGLFTITDPARAPVLRDAARGWTYFSAGNVEGVAFDQWLFRVGDSGLADSQWRLPSDFQITDQYVAPDGSPVVRAYVKNSPTFEQRWYRLPRESVGRVTPIEVSTTSELPPRDAGPPLQDTGLSATNPRLLPQPDRSVIAFEVAVGTAPAYNVTTTLRKRDGRGTERWSHAVSGQVRNLATDAAGNVYILGEAVAIGGRTASLTRIRADGGIDNTWNPVIDATQSASILRAVNDRMVVAGANGGGAPAYRLTTFDLITGRKLVERFSRYPIGAIAEDGSAVSASADGHWATLDTTRSDEAGDRVSVTRVGGNGTFLTSVAWRGGYVVGGNFRYWFDGQLYSNIMRVDEAFRPDPAWVPVVTDPVGALAVDREGRLLAASNSASGLQARIQRFHPDGALDGSWQPVINGDVYKLLAATDGVLFVGGAFSAVNGVPRNSLARFAASGSLDMEWASQPTWPVMQPVRWGQFGRDGVYRILDAGNDGILFSWEDGEMNGSTSGVRRLTGNAFGNELPLPRGILAAAASRRAAHTMLRDPKTGDIYALADAWTITSGTTRGTAMIRLVSPGMTIDPAWTTLAGENGRQFAGFAQQSDSHVYACRGQLSVELRRFDKATGREDPNWRSEDTYLCGANLVEQRENGVTLVSADGLGQLLQFSATARNAPRTVVEYYAHQARRFFMTGRPAEIATLDAMPTGFVRTGMSFAAETALVRDSDPARTPVCRFFASSQAGGSNTHFYGSESECTLLKRFPALRYEGFDFRAGVPGAGGACPPALPSPVYRLFNQAIAGNDGNHRYVVSEDRRQEMTAAGWVDEGVAFCSATVIDSRPLADLLR